MTRHGLESILQQPKMRHARWHVPEASSAICTSLKKSASAAVEAPSVLNFFIGNHERRADCYQQHKAIVKLAVVVPESFGSLVASLLCTNWCRWLPLPI